MRFRKTKQNTRIQNKTNDFIREFFRSSSLQINKLSCLRKQDLNLFVAKVQYSFTKH